MEQCERLHYIEEDFSDETGSEITNSYDKTK
jgi:hypothetical protein